MFGTIASTSSCEKIVMFFQVLVPKTLKCVIMPYSVHFLNSLPGSDSDVTETALCRASELFKVTNLSVV